MLVRWRGYSNKDEDDTKLCRQLLYIKTHESMCMCVYVYVYKVVGKQVARSVNKEQQQTYRQTATERCCKDLKACHRTESNEN